MISPSEPKFRIAKTNYGARNPVRRDSNTSRLEWGRYDVVRHSTIYAADSCEAAFAEVLASLRPKPAGTPLWTLFDSLDGSERATLEEQIAAEAPGMHTGQIPRVWRDERSKCELCLPRTGWFVDVQTADSLAVIRRQIAPALASLGLEDLTLSELTGPRRDLTTLIATWVHSLVLDDGSVPHGIRYASKHGTDWFNWAIWLRRIDDGAHVDTEPTLCTAVEEIGEMDPDMRRVAGRWGMRVH